jgi:F-type H+-transporting ATPase subunit delta
MAELTTVARPYAKAAFLFAQEKKALAEWKQMLGLAATLVEEPAMSAFLDQPDIGSKAKVAAFARVGGDQFDEACLNFLAQCAEHKRLAALPEIFRLFHQLLMEVEQISDVEVVSAFDLSDVDVATLVTGLKKRLGRDVSVTSRVDKSLIGGVVIRTGDTVIDGSVRGRLARLAEQLNS